MTHDWVLDVLADLKSFASRNGLKALADQLDDAEMIAAVEIASVGERFADAAHGGDAGSHNRPLAAGENA